MLVNHVNRLHLSDTFLVSDPSSRLVSFAFADKSLKLPSIGTPSGLATFPARCWFIGPFWTPLVLFLDLCLAGSLIHDRNVVIQVWHPDI